MEDLTLRYFDAEMRYLREAGEEFARAHPDRAAGLNLDKAGARDPYVERLFEGFAFLMGRLREKLDDDLPELTEGLVSLLWPHYLRTIPSLSIVEFTPEWRGMKERMAVNKGFEVLSRPIGERATRCRYTTTQDIELLPLSLSRAVLDTEPDGRSVVRLRFNCGELADWSKINLSHLPLYFDADAPLACALHEALTLNTAKLWIRLPGHTDRQPLDAYFAPQGFSEQDQLWPKGDSAFSGYQLLLEYFTFREKFMFVALKGLENVELPAELAWFDIDVVLEKRWDHDFSFSKSTCACTAYRLSICSRSSPTPCHSHRYRPNICCVRCAFRTVIPKSTQWIRWCRLNIPVIRYTYLSPVFVIKGECCAMMRRNIITTPASSAVLLACTIPGWCSAAKPLITTRCPITKISL